MSLSYLTSPYSSRAKPSTQPCLPADGVPPPLEGHVSKKGGDIKCQRKIKQGPQARAEGHVMVEVAGKAVPQGKVQAPKLVVKKENANLTVS